MFGAVAQVSGETRMRSVSRMAALYLLGWFLLCAGAPAATSPAKPMVIGYFPQWGMFNTPAYNE